MKDDKKRILRMAMKVNPEWSSSGHGRTPVQVKDGLIGFLVKN